MRRRWFAPPPLGGRQLWIMAEIAEIGDWKMRHQSSSTWRARFRPKWRDSRTGVYFALDSRRKSFRRRQNNATFLAIESEACATSTRAGVLCGVSRRSRTMSLMNVAEDLSGLSRAELVYKAKLAEQAERCVRAASRFHFGFSTVARRVREANRREPLRLARRGRTSSDRIWVRGNRARHRGRTERPACRSRARLRRRLGSSRARASPARISRAITRFLRASRASSTRTATPARARRPGTNSGGYRVAGARGHLAAAASSHVPLRPAAARLRLPRGAFDPARRSPPRTRSTGHGGRTSQRAHSQRGVVS